MSRIIKPSVTGRMARMIMLVHVLVSLPVLLPAQSFVWAKTRPLDYSLNPEMLNYTVAVSNAGQVYFAGLKNFSNHYSNEAFGDNFFICYDADGNQIFEKLFTGECVVKNMHVSKDGFIHLAGLIRGDVEFAPGQTMTYSGEGANAFLVRFSADGSFSWMKNLSEIYVFADQVRGITSDEQHHIFVVYNDNTNANSFIRKFDAAGDEMLLVQQTSVAVISSIDIDADGNIVVAGSCPSSTATFGGIPYNSGFAYALYVAKYNDQGQNQWVKFVEDVTCQNPRVRCSPAGDYYVSGHLFDGFEFGGIPTSGPAWVYDFFMAKMNADGDFEWVKEVPETTDGDASVGRLNHLALDYYGNPYLSGFTRGQIQWDENWQSEVVNRGILAATYTSGGEYRWIKFGSGGWNAQSIAVFSPDEIYIAGTALGQMQLDDITVTAAGFYYPFLAKIEDVTTQAGNDALAGTIEIYPNPAKDKCTIRTAKPGQMVSGYQILNSGGAIVAANEQVFAPEMVMDAGNLEKGIYVVRVKFTDGTVASEKLVVIR
ncbi:MAG: T9SS type A sorting domain-containing protein [Bacteroidales bacterium]